MSATPESIRSLEQERAALDHELRRVRDGLLRNRSDELQREARRLEDAIALCDRDLARLSREGDA